MPTESSDLELRPGIKSFVADKLAAELSALYGAEALSTVLQQPGYMQPFVLARHMSPAGRVAQENAFRPVRFRSVFSIGSGVVASWPGWS